MRATLVELRTEVDGLESVAGRRRYPRGLRARLTSAARELRAGGASWEQVAGEVGVGASTLLRWCERAATSPSGASVVPSTFVVPVELVDARRGVSDEARSLVLTSPGGWRVDGLGVADVAALLRALG